MPKKFPVACQPWEESERGWGVRPDGYSLHKSAADVETFIREYWAKQPPGPAPDEYRRPSGIAYMVEVDQKTFSLIKGKGTFFGGLPPASPLAPGQTHAVEKGRLVRKRFSLK